MTDQGRQPPVLFSRRAEPADRQYVPLSVSRHVGRLSSVQWPLLATRHRFVPGTLASWQEGSAISECIFCDVIAGIIPAHVVLSDEVVVPVAAVGPYFTRVQRVSAVMPAALGCQGTFVAANNVVSQSVPHLHFHVVPRTKGDGLRGFFWPRNRYDSDAEAAGYADRLRAALS
jgi:histidine triad (HIT) family protein